VWRRGFSSAQMGCALPQERFISAPGGRLHVLEWVGSGTPYVLAHGIGDNPHVFSELAARLAPEARVVAYARRGHGRSDAPAGGPYTLDAYVSDLRAVLDGLGIERAHLVGWSMGGNEMTAFAGRSPERTASVIYLDSGYDWTDPAFLPAFGQILAEVAPAGPALASFGEYRAAMQDIWYGDVAWTPAVDEYLRETVRLAPDGSIAATVPDGPTFDALFASLATPPRDYAAVQAPALALYAPRYFAAPTAAALRARLDRFEDEIMREFRPRSQQRIRRELGGVDIQTCPGTLHMTIGLDRADDLAQRIRGWSERW
jgi:pimeloyl-ACP methyl ester carboxylesterase